MGPSLCYNELEPYFKFQRGDIIKMDSDERYMWMALDLARQGRVKPVPIL